MHMFQGKVQQKAHAYVTLMRITLILTSLDVLKCSLDMLMMVRATVSHHPPTMGISQKKHEEKQHCGGAPRGIQQGKSPRNLQRPINHAGTSPGQSTASSTEWWEALVLTIISISREHLSTSR